MSLNKEGFNANANVEFIAQGFVMNMQPSEAEAGFDIRMPPTADPELMRKTIAEEWAPAWRNMTSEVNSYHISCHLYI